MFYEQGIHTTTLLTFEDITDRRAVEEKVQELLREKDIVSDPHGRAVSITHVTFKSKLLKAA